MESSKAAIIVNPTSGGVTKKPELFYQLQKGLEKLGYNTTISQTNHSGHASELTRHFLKEETELFIAIGGDGTVREIASCLIHTEALLAILPMGSGNGLAHQLKIPRSTEALLKLIKAKSFTQIDCGKVNNLLFFSNCGVGFDAQVSALFSRSKRRGIYAYLRIAFQEYLFYKTKSYTVTIDDKSQSVEAFLLCCANSGEYGNGFCIAPKADLSDGLFSFVIIKPFSHYALFGLMGRMMMNTIDHSPYCVTKNCLSLKIEAPILETHLDGDFYRFENKIMIEMIPQALKIISPQFASGVEGVDCLLYGRKNFKDLVHAN